MDEPTIEHDHPSRHLSNNKNHDSNVNVLNNSQLKDESTSIANDNFESSKNPTHTKPSGDINNAMSRVSINDIRPLNRSNFTRFPTHLTPHMNQSETEAQLVAFTPPLMSIRVPHQGSQTYRQNYNQPRSSIYNQSNEQTSLPTKTKSKTTVSQPEYYVDSFASNFSDKPSSNSNNKTKTKHVTFQEPQPSNEPSRINSNNINFPQSPSNGSNYYPSPTQMYHNPRPFNPYNYPNQYFPHNEFYPHHPVMMMNQGYMPRHRGMNIMPAPPVWMPSIYYPDQQPHYVHHVFQPRQLYDPNKPKVSLTSEPHDSSKVIRNITPKNKKKTKQTNNNDNSTVSTPTEPLPHPITILRKPNTDTEATASSAPTIPPPIEDQPISSLEEEEEQQPMTSPVEDHSDTSSKEEQTIISSIDNQSETISLPKHELLSILQSANCISSLNEYAQQKKFSLNYEFSSISPSSFTCIISINNRPFPVSSPCASKTEAQKLACDQALRILYRESSSTEQSSIEFSTKHDYIAHRSVSTFQELNVNELLLGRKTLACMLMINDGQYEQARVISIGTGNSCLDETNLSYADDGTALHDCHAEILARRGLIKYFFEQIKQSKDNQSSIFEYNSTTNTYQLHENITFHMYISSLPCGNASLNISSNSIRYKQGQIEGTLLASTSSIKYPIKSCSDKICRWNILGIQGGLLINLLSKPIYLQTITLACDTTFNRDHVKYSLCQRLNEHFHSLPSPFLFHLPDIDCPKNKSFQQERQVAKLQTNAFAWNITQSDRTELLEPMTGRLKSNRSISSLSKKAFLEDFMNLIQPNNDCLTYHQVKQLNKNYITVKNLISTAFQSGSSDTNIPWLSKSDQLEQFSIQ